MLKDSIPVKTVTSKSIWLSAGVILFLSFGYTEMQGSDLWWHLAAGREILQTQTLWMVDDWSFSTHGGVWQNHEWLSDIIFYGWASAFGVKSLVYWKWLVVVFTFIALQQVLFRQSGSAFASLLCAGIAIAVAAPFIDVRPHLYTLLNFSILLLLLLNRTSATWVVAGLFVVWVNLHGGFFFGIMALSILLFPWRDITLENFRAAFVIGFICVLACFLNPSGVKAFLYPLTYAFDSSSPFKGLGEWHPPFKPGGIQSPYFFWMLLAAPLVALAYVLPAVRRASSVPWEGILLTGLTLAMALTSRRFIPIFAMSFAVMLAPLLGLVLHKLRAEKFDATFAVLALGFALFRMLPYPLAAPPAYHYLTAEYSYPIDTINYMKANQLMGNVYALYNWGGYIHWRTDGDLKVYIDGRADTIYSAETYLDYVAMLHHEPDWIERIERSGADYVLWPLRGHGGATKGAELIKTGRWTFIHQDSISFLLARSSLQGLEKLHPGPDTPYRYLGEASIHALQGDFAKTSEWAAMIRREIPYQKDACNLLVISYRNLGMNAEAQKVSGQCRSYFPSGQLRR